MLKLEHKNNDAISQAIATLPQEQQAGAEKVSKQLRFLKMENSKIKTLRQWHR